MTDYPILVARWTGDQALTIVCERCHTEAVIDPDDIRSEDLYECPADAVRRRRASITARCGGSASMKYVEGEQCASCGTLDYSMPVDGCCSRRCALQAEYAQSLKGPAA